MFHVKQNKNKIRRPQSVFTPSTSFSPAALRPRQGRRGAGPTSAILARRRAILCKTKSMSVDPLAPTLRTAKRSPAASNPTWVRTLALRSGADGIVAAHVVDREQRQTPMFCGTRARARAPGSDRPAAGLSPRAAPAACKSRVLSPILIDETSGALPAEGPRRNKRINCPRETGHSTRRGSTELTHLIRTLPRQRSRRPS
jgi:hypothetical protein